MPGDEVVTAAAVAGGLSFVAGKVFGPVLDAIGKDLGQAYAVGVKAILESATRKIRQPDELQTPNLRVARDVLWNGGITSEEICAEYFGGVLAASTTEDGKDDSALHYLDVIKSMSTRQLALHYWLYKALFLLLQNMSEEDRNALSLGIDTQVQALSVCVARPYLEALKIGSPNDFIVLHRLGLISGYETENRSVVEPPARTLSCITANATSFGIMLYAAAFNRLDDWRRYAREDFGELLGVATPLISRISTTPEGLAQHSGLTLAAKPPDSLF